MAGEERAQRVHYMPVTQVRCSCGRLLFEARVPLREVEIASSHLLIRCGRCKRLHAFRFTLDEEG